MLRWPALWSPAHQLNANILWNSKGPVALCAWNRMTVATSEWGHFPQIHVVSDSGSQTSREKETPQVCFSASNSPGWPNSLISFHYVLLSVVREGLFSELRPLQGQQPGAWFGPAGNKPAMAKRIYLWTDGGMDDWANCKPQRQTSSLRVPWGFWSETNSHCVCSKFPTTQGPVAVDSKGKKMTRPPFCWLKNILRSEMQITGAISLFLWFYQEMHTLSIFLYLPQYIHAVCAFYALKGLFYLTFWGCFLCSYFYLRCFKHVIHVCLPFLYNILVYEVMWMPCKNAKSLLMLVPFFTDHISLVVLCADCPGLTKANHVAPPVKGQSALALPSSLWN